MKQLAKHKQQTTKLYTRKINKNIQPTIDEYTLFILVNGNQMNVKLYNNKKDKQSHKIKTKGKQGQYFNF